MPDKVDSLPVRIFRKKPIDVAAVQWKPDNKLGQFHHGRYVNHAVGYDSYGAEYTVTEVGIRTLEGFMRLTPGDWIITGIIGERYPCKPDIFAATYEPVDSLPVEAKPALPVVVHGPLPKNLPQFEGIATYTGPTGGWIESPSQVAEEIENALKERFAESRAEKL